MLRCFQLVPTLRFHTEVRLEVCQYDTDPQKFTGIFAEKM